jgi:hypothetical protein
LKVVRKHAILRLVICAYFCLLRYVACAAQTYFVDFDAGNDANSGTSTNAPWRTIPGTLTVDDSALLGNWGTYNSANPLPAGSIIYLKGGTTWDKTDPGGSCYIQGTGGSKDVYTSSGSGYGAGVVISVTNGWGSGPVILDGAGKTNSIALLLLGMSGITIDGVSSNNIVIKNASGDGIQLKEQHGTGNENLYIQIQYLLAQHCGTQLTNDLAGAGSGHLNLRHVSHLKLSKVEVDGAANTNYINGVLFGDNGKWAKDAMVWDCYAHHLRGDTGPNDSGIGFKAINCQIQFSNVLSQFNLKGMDIGEQNGAGNDIVCTLWNSTLHSNAVSGLGLTGKAAFYAGKITNWVFNCLITSNNNFGINCYSTPQQTFIVHNVFTANGDTVLSGTYAGNIRANPNSSSDTNTMRVTILNNVFADPADCQIANTDYTTPSGATGNDFTLFADWNTYKQRASELFAQWAYFNGSEFINVDYTQGPANANGQWATNYSKTSTPPIRGSGHFGCDINSKVVLSGAYEASGRFWNVAYPTWSVNTNRLGTNFSAQPWALAAMQLDRQGYLRTSYSIGAYEIGGAPPPPANTPPTLTQISDQFTPINTATAALSFTVGDAEQDPDTLTVAGSSSDQGILPNANIVFGGSGTSRTVTLVPQTNRAGAVTVTYSVSDGTYTVLRSFVVTFVGTELQPANRKGRALPGEI